MPRYVKRRYNRYWFQITVPERLRPQFGKVRIQENLRTSDIKVAATLALERAAYWRRRFDLKDREDHEPRYLSDLYTATLEDTLREIDWINRTFPYKEDRNYQLDWLEDRLLNPEIRRLGLSDRRELEDAPVSEAVRVAFKAVQAAKEGRTDIPPEFREPFSKTAERYLVERQRDTEDRLTEQTVGQMQAVYRLFSNHLSDASLTTVSRQQVAEFMDKVRRLNRYWGRSGETKSRTLSDLLANPDATAEPHLSNRTLNRYVSALTQLWEWVHGRDEVSGDNPFPGHVRRSRSRRASTANAPWTDKAIRAYFEAECNVGTKGKPNPFYWLPRIALLSGMRLDEICSLEVPDIKMVEEVRYFDIPKGKTRSSVRVVPVHSALAGFLALLPNIGFLFPQLTPGGPDQKRSWNIGKRLRRRLKRIPGGSTFHAFRKNVAQTFERERVPETESSQLLGHKRAGITYGVYSPNGLRIDQKRDLIEKLKVPDGGHPNTRLPAP